MNRRSLTWMGSGLVLWMGWLFWLWQPERQLRLHQEHLFKAFTQRNWNAVSGLLAENYSDRWGQTRAILVQQAGEVFRHFSSVSVQEEIEETALTPGGGRVVARAIVSGHGTPVADEVIERVNSLASPFTFEWEHSSGKPWAW